MNGSAGNGALSLNGAANDLRSRAEMQRQEALFISERAKEQALQARVTALQLAAQVTGPQGDPASTLKAAEQFAAFITGAPSPSEPTQ